ncbi:MAG: nucleoside-triphosphatase [Candidatus Saccharimonadaceae bacterium]
MKSIFIISGEKGSGKTTFLIDVLALLKKNGFVVGGFVVLHELQSDCYQIKNINTNEEFLLMQRVATFDKRPNHFKFFPKGVEMGNNCIKELLTQPLDIAIVDEIGGYELAGELWCNSFTQLVESSVSLIFTTKEKLLEGVVEKWKIKPTLIFHSADFGDPLIAFQRIKRFL